MKAKMKIKTGDLPGIGKRYSFKATEEGPLQFLRSGYPHPRDKMRFDFLSNLIYDA